MKLFVEAHTIVKNKSGVGYFAQGLVQGAQAQLDSRDSIHLITHPREPHDVDDLLKDRRTFEHPIDWMPGRLYHALKYRNTIPPIDLVYGKGVYVFPNFIRWPLARSPSVIVIHDLVVFDMPEYAHPKNVEFMTRHIPTSVEKADLIVAVSESSKQTLCRQFKVDPAKVIVTHLAAGPEYAPCSSDTVAAVRARYGIFGKYMLYLGTVEPRKNIEGIIRAYRALPKKLREEYSLVLAGGSGWRDEGIQQAIKEARMAGERVIATGYVDMDEKPALFSGAELFLFPSHYEGFGLPVVEAMQCGTPVITADNSSLPEAGGEAVVYVDSNNDEQLIDAMKQVLTDEKLRKKLIAKGFEQAKKFSWQKSAHGVLQGIKDRKLG